MIQLQIGKNGLTPGFIETLKTTFNNTENIRISVLQSATRDKEKFKKMQVDIVTALGKNYTGKVIGWTIVLRKWRKGKDMSGS